MNRTIRQCVCVLAVCVSVVYFTVHQHRVPAIVLETLVPNASVSVDPNPDGDEPRCKSRTDVMFLKMHKCGSSTTQRIFLRYSKAHCLSLVLPLKENYLGSPTPFRSHMVPKTLRTPNQTYNMMLIHTRLNILHLQKVMMQDAVWVTIMRNPVDQFLSIWGYYELEKFYKMPLKSFVKQPYNNVVRWRFGGRQGIHQMFFDLGYGTAEDYSEKDMRRAVETVNQTFHLVMLAERYDESLVLLKDLLCWRTEDVAYLSINKLSGSYRTSISDSIRQGILRLNYPDVQLYDFFARLFQKRVEQFGASRMAEELQKLRQAKRRLEKWCLLGDETQNIATSNMDWPQQVDRLKVRGDRQECMDLVKTELSFIEEMRNRQTAWAQNGWQKRGNCYRSS